MTSYDLEKLKAKLPLSVSTLARNLPLPGGDVAASGELVPRRADARAAGPENGSSSTTPRAAAKQPKRIRQSSKPLLNKLEQEFRNTRLCGMGYHDQAIRFRLGNGIWYKPDFVWFGDGRVTAYEIKGPYAFRGGYENLKVAASLYPEVRWTLAWKEGGLWKKQEVLP